ncbi:hypothetical protein, partial [Thioclava dalianensis]|uniref:hypothetical protein n=1 Tax=Thioclava dalianensis TaxID=1185766 RepID=UPI001B8072F0
HSPSPQPVTGKPANLKLSRANGAKSEAPHARNSLVLTCVQKWQSLNMAFLAGRCARHAKLCSDLDFEQQTSCHRRV